MGVPEGVFYRLVDVKIGDDVISTDEQGGSFYYRVTWVEQVDATSAELEGTFGETDTPSVTLITCGGSWDPKAQEYDQCKVIPPELVMN